MDHSRYLAYRSARRAVDRMPDWQLDVHDRDRFNDMAEGLLLARDEEEAERLRRDVAVALSLLVGQRRLTDARADALWRQISGCGPAEPLRSGRRGRAVTFAGSL
jgi:hypothetical protein